METMVTARMPLETKKRASKVFDSLGVTTSQVINALFESVVSNKGLPEFRSEEQIMFENKERVLDPQNLTPKMKRMLRAMKSIQDQPPIDWGEDANRPFKELLEERREERHEALFGH
ncbi:MAG: type II toxin-antitoxin system RelB/DinJ family antitoxin [Coriobacteriales bacterium]|jgi:addiction module RelB/DinJ family antitoxin|nr:type II toxin-antitoxin system RelB/DinJ family antitoxin [Coriobacteriales bacterium]